MCPLEIFRQDLAIELRPRMEANEVIILLMDVYDDLRDGPTHRWLTEEVGL